MFSLQTFQNSSSAREAESDCCSCSCSFSCCCHRESLQNQDLTRQWQQRKSSDNAHSPCQKINSTDPLAELIEQITCTHTADDVFALTGLFALLASVLFTKNGHTEIPCVCAREGAAARGSRGRHRDSPALRGALPGDLPQSDILAIISTQPPCISSHIYFRGIFYW